MSPLSLKQQQQQQQLLLLLLEGAGVSLLLEEISFFCRCLYKETRALKGASLLFDSADGCATAASFLLLLLLQVMLLLLLLLLLLPLLQARSCHVCGFSANPEVLLQRQAAAGILLLQQQRLNP